MGIELWNMMYDFFKRKIGKRNETSLISVNGLNRIYCDLFYSYNEERVEIRRRFFVIYPLTLVLYCKSKD